VQVLELGIPQHFHHFRNIPPRRARREARDMSHHGGLVLDKAASAAVLDIPANSTSAAREDAAKRIGDDPVGGREAPHQRHLSPIEALV
jgi:hypothetical protein